MGQKYQKHLNQNLPCPLRARCPHLEGGAGAPRARPEGRRRLPRAAARPPRRLRRPWRGAGGAHGRGLRGERPAATWSQTVVTKMVGVDVFSYIMVDLLR